MASTTFNLYPQLGFIPTGTSVQNYLMYVTESFELKYIALAVEDCYFSEGIDFANTEWGLQAVASPRENYLVCGLIIGGAFISPDRLIEQTTLQESNLIDARYNLKPIERYLMANTNLRFEIPSIHFRTANSQYILSNYKSKP